MLSLSLAISRGLEKTPCKQEAPWLAHMTKFAGLQSSRGPHHPLQPHHTAHEFPIFLSPKHNLCPGNNHNPRLCPVQILTTSYWSHGKGAGTESFGQPPHNHTHAGALCFLSLLNPNPPVTIELWGFPSSKSNSNCRLKLNTKRKTFCGSDWITMVMRKRDEFFIFLFWNLYYNHQIKSWDTLKTHWEGASMGLNLPRAAWPSFLAIFFILILLWKWSI